VKYTPDNLSFNYLEFGGAEETLRLAERLHPDLQAILDAELAAGNFITGGTTSGWPDAASVFVALKYQFLVEHPLTPGVKHRTLNDPHWWQAEYVVDNPMHILACGFPVKGSGEEGARKRS
jgi:hypothetical protein